MSINFYSNNGFGQYPQLQKDIKDVKGKVHHVETLDQTIGKSLVESIPMCRRLASVPKKLDENDFLPAVGVVGLAAVTLPSDLEDLKDAYEHAKGVVGKTKYEPDYKHQVAQHDFSFLRGSLAEKWMKNTKSEKVKSFMYALYERDKSLDDTSFGRKIKNLLGISEGKAIKTNIKNEFGRSTWISTIQAKGSFGEFTARALKRTTVLGLAALTLLELPKILHAMGKGKDISEQTSNTAKQTIKSGINVASIAAGVGYGGAIGSKYGGAIGSLVGMGAGAVFGSLSSDRLQELIN